MAVRNKQSCGPWAIICGHDAPQPEHARPGGTVQRQSGRLIKDAKR